MFCTCWWFVERTKHIPSDVSICSLWVFFSSLNYSSMRLCACYSSDVLESMRSTTVISSRRRCRRYTLNDFCLCSVWNRPCFHIMISSQFNTQILFLLVFVQIEWESPLQEAINYSATKAHSSNSNAHTQLLLIWVEKNVFHE